ncbi:hypothetical protein [Nodularia sp. UHCC 0506]|uniref:hypothetical protein n=1 Tax=Nodularia sp. UHCC 0506 TaxID=3110243 RepID=UPI002B1FB942|nr:hypothetical protein [Nodularia sp. UHCC 0506]MEA5514695.1 hypothetical protein [Nodularia sp. UHCC 0506]
MSIRNANDLYYQIDRLKSCLVPVIHDECDRLRRNSWLYGLFIAAESKFEFSGHFTG